MQRLLQYLLLSTALAATPVAAEEPVHQAYDGIQRGSPVLSEHGKFIDRSIADFIARNHLPGLSMAIVQAPYVPRSAGYGRTSLVNDELASTKTMWSIGPITQAFTAVAVFQLREAHKLEIGDPIGKYVPDLPPSWAGVTLFQLLQHASGIPDYRESAEFSENHDYRPADLIALVKAQPLLFKSGTQVRLSATNFALLGLAIEHASGMSYADYVKRYQIEPLGLRSTMFAGDLVKSNLLDRPPAKPGQNQHVRFKTELPYINPPEPATGYKDLKGVMTAVDPRPSRNLFAFGDIWSSAEDISDWDIALAGTTLVKDEADHALIYQPTRLENGTVVRAMAGWEFTHHPGFMEVKGSAPGFSAYLSRFTDSKELVCVTLLTNKENVDLTGLARDVAAAYGAGLGSGLDSDKIVTQESKFGVDETAARLEAQLKAMNTPVFAIFDHAENATEAGLQLRPTKVLVFGNPKIGTKLMQDDQASALDLPLRVLVWQDERGRIWIGYHAMSQLAADYGIADTATLSALDQALAHLVEHAANVYQY
jgi:CubicO group peptidase (beta-lactamase class C family)/uncharacterized protein (DUF302 family)